MLSSLIAVMMLINYSTSMGMMSLFPQTLREIDLQYFPTKATVKSVPQTILFEGLIASVIQLPYGIVVSILGEIQFFGRKYTIVLGYCFTIVFLIISIASPLNFYIFFGCAMFCLGMSLFATNSYMCEVFPTALRDTAVGFFTGMSRIMSLLAIYIFYGFSIHNIFAGYVYAIVVLAVALISAIFLPFETYGKTLDSF